MSYRCESCGAKVPDGQPLRRHIVYRPPMIGQPKQIEREVAVCQHCNNHLERGVPLRTLVAWAADGVLPHQKEEPRQQPKTKVPKVAQPSPARVSPASNDQELAGGLGSADEPRDGRIAEIVNDYKLHVNAPVDLGPAIAVDVPPATVPKAKRLPKNINRRNRGLKHQPPKEL